MSTPGPDGSTSGQPFGSDYAPREANAPLTRRELRAREQAALAAASPPVGIPPHESAPQPTVGPTFSDSSVVFTPATSFAVSDASLKRPRAPKKPKALRPVGPPRGTSRPRAAISARPGSPKAPLRRKPFMRRALKELMTFGAMIGAGLMMVATTIPANAFYSDDAQIAAVAAPTEAKSQSIVVEPSADLTLSRDGYTATSFREQIFLRYGNRSFLYTNNPNGTIQWPFPIAVPITDAFGYRVSPCGGCSTWHKGVDFTPGAGAAIQSIADGVVSAVIPSHFGLGNHVIIDHHINGQLVQSVYAHMMDGSIRMVVGQQVKVGDEVGQVGTTGESTGPHLHFEIHIGGQPIDPFEWLKANAN